MVLNKKQIQEIIPYQEPFLFVDGVEEMSENTISGFYQTASDDYYFKGHFVDFKIMPGVLVVEALAQLSTILLRKKVGEHHKKYHFLAYDVRRVQFLKAISPGDKIGLQAEILGLYDTPPDSSAFKIARVKAKASVENELKCEARFSIAIVPKEKFEKK
jgi:3-hydroxyacyl-[acyl-carrier-protein] dehydratase